MVRLIRELVRLEARENAMAGASPRKRGVTRRGDRARRDSGTGIPSREGIGAARAHRSLRAKEIEWLGHTEAFARRKSSGSGTQKPSREAILRVRSSGFASPEGEWVSEARWLLRAKEIECSRHVRAFAGRDLGERGTLAPSREGNRAVGRRPAGHASHFRGAPVCRRTLGDLRSNLEHTAGPWVSNLEHRSDPWVTPVPSAGMRAGAWRAGNSSENAPQARRKRGPHRWAVEARFRYASCEPWW